MTKKELAAVIDHTILKADATYDEIEQTILYAREIGAASVCLNPAYVAMAADLLRGSSTIVCTVIGFPLGATSTYAKAKEAQNAYQHGARELDMVINIGALKSKDYTFVQNDIEAVVQASPAPVKVILENCTLTREEIVIACGLAEKAGAAFVKTSTGFGTGNATVADVKLMRQSVPPHVQVKAAGGIGSLKEAKAMLAAGANRLGMSRTAAVLAELDAAKPAAKKTTAKKATTKKAAAKKTTVKKAASPAAAKSKPAASTGK